MAGPPAAAEQAQQPLTFPPAHFAKLAPLDFLHASLSSKGGVRPNGRARTQARAPSINSGSLANANGSAVVRLGATSVVCGVRAELLPVSHMHGGLPADLEAWQAQGGRPEPDGDGDGDIEGAVGPSDADIISDLRLLVPNLELSTGCNPSHLPGNAPSAEAQGLTQRILALLMTADLVGLESLLVWHDRLLSFETGATAAGLTNPDAMVEGGEEEDGAERPEKEIKGVWTLYIDVLYISLDGAAFDAAWLAIMAALKDTVLPKARWDEDREMLVCSSLKSQASSLELRSLPVPLTSGVFSYSGGEDATIQVLHDPDDFEESVCQGQISVVVTKTAAAKSKKGSKGVMLLRVEAHGKGVSLTSISDLVGAAEERWKTWQAALRWDR